MWETFIDKSYKLVGLFPLTSKESLYYFVWENLNICHPMNMNPQLHYWWWSAAYEGSPKKPKTVTNDTYIIFFLTLQIPVSENYMDPVDHKEGRPDEPAYNEIAEKYNAPYYYSDTIKESAKEPEPPYCSPCPPATTEPRFYANEKIRLSCSKRKDDENLQILNCDAATHKWSTCTTTDQTVESCSSPPQSPLDNVVDKLLEPVRTINLEDKPILPMRRSPFVSICRIENSPNGTLTNFSVVSSGELQHSHQHQQQQQQHQQCHSSDSHHLKNSSDFPHLKCMKAPSSETTFDKELPRVAKTNGYYRSFRAPYSFQVSKNDSCGQCGCKIENVLTVPIIAENSCDGSGRHSNIGNGRPLLRDALLDPNGQYSQSKQSQVPQDEENSLCIINNNNLDDNNAMGICEGNTEIISCCPYHPLRVYSTYGGIKTEEILWPCNSTSVPGYQTSHFYSQVNIGTPVTTSSPSPTAFIKNYGCSHDRTGDKLCSKTANNNSKTKSQYSSATSSSTGSSNSSRTSTSSCSASARTVKDVVQAVDFVNSDNNYLKSPPYLNSSSECQIRQYPFKIDVPLENQDWFHGAITRVESEKILQAACEGSFLVRNCENSPRNHYSLSIR